MLALFITIQRFNQVDSGPDSEKAPEEEPGEQRVWSACSYLPIWEDKWSMPTAHNSHLPPLWEMPRLVDTGGKKGFCLAGNS